MASLPAVAPGQASAAVCPTLNSGHWIGGYTASGADIASFVEVDIAVDSGGQVTGAITSLNGNAAGPNTVVGTVNCDRLTTTTTSVLSAPISTESTVGVSGDEVIEGFWGINGSTTNGGTFSLARVVQTSELQNTDALDTDPGTGATPTDPLQVSIASPNIGDLKVQRGSATNPVLGGYQLLDQVVHIDAPPATPESPLVFQFVLDASSLQGGSSVDVAVFRNGVRVNPCDPLAGAAAIPSPCIADQVQLPEGDVQVTIRAADASIWSFGVLADALGLRITTNSLSIGTKLQPYVKTLAASGGVKYKWKKLTKLPKGLKLKGKTGVIFGTPKAAGTFTVEFQVRFKTKLPKQKPVWHYATKTFTLAVN